ncbi:unnamed protein product [Prunus brigantina]
MRKQAASRTIDPPPNYLKNIYITLSTVHGNMGMRKHRQKCTRSMSCIMFDSAIRWLKKSTLSDILSLCMTRILLLSPTRSLLDLWSLLAIRLHRCFTKLFFMRNLRLKR